MEVRDLLRSDEVRWAPSASDASDGVRQDAAPDADLLLLQDLADAVVEKSAGQAQVVQARDAQFLLRRLAPLARRAEAAELYTPAAVQSAERSCAALAAVAALPRLEVPQAALARVELALAARQKPSLPEQMLAVVRPPAAQVVLPDAAEQPQASQEQQVFPLGAAQPQDAPEQPGWAAMQLRPEEPPQAQAVSPAQEALRQASPLPAARPGEPAPGPPLPSSA